MPRSFESLTPENSQVVFIDHQPEMAFGILPDDREVLRNNAVALARAAKVFDVPVTFSILSTGRFCAPACPALLKAQPAAPVLERSSLNAWDDRMLRDMVVGHAARGRGRIIVSGLWLELCNQSFALACLQDTGCEIRMVLDASGSGSPEARRSATDHMIRLGIVPATWQQVLLEWQRDWARSETRDAALAILAEHSASYALGYPADPGEHRIGPRPYPDFRAPARSAPGIVRSGRKRPLP